MIGLFVNVVGHLAAVAVLAGGGFYLGYRKGASVVTAVKADLVALEGKVVGEAVKLEADAKAWVLAEIAKIKSKI